MLLSKLRSWREVQVYEIRIKSALAKLLQVKAKNIEISNLLTDDDSTERINLTLYGSNLTSYLEHYKWNGLTDEVIKERDNLLRLSLLYMHANKVSNFTGDEKIYSMDNGLMPISKLELLCPHGQSLSDNEFICGKFTSIPSETSKRAFCFAIKLTTLCSTTSLKGNSTAKVLTGICKTFAGSTCDNWFFLLIFFMFVCLLSNLLV